VLFLDESPAYPLPPASDYGLLCAGLEALGSPAILLDAAERVVYTTRAAATLVGMDAADLAGQPWPAFWAGVGAAARAVGPEPQRVVLERAGGTVPVRVWRRPVAGTAATLVGLEDLSADDEREREVLRIFQDSQEQADDLFALYQITQFLNTAQELDQLCSTFLHELERLTAADYACLYLALPGGSLQPKVWLGLPAVPPPHPDTQAAQTWFQAHTADHAVLALPLFAEDRLVGLALLAHPGAPRRESRFLHTVAKEMGTALVAMAGRQALREQEQKLEAIVAGTTDAILQVGPDRRVRGFNPAAERLLGTPAAGALGHSCRDVLGCAPNRGCALTCPFAHVLSTREPIPNVELVVGDQGQPRHVAASVAPLDLGAGAAQAAVAILRDVSKQKQVEQMKGDFLTTVSHQLRTPLALLRGYTDTLRHLELSPQEQQACIGGIAETTARLEHLVVQILDVTRIEEGHMELHREPVRLVDVVRTAITALPHAAYRSRVWIELGPDLPLLDADPQRLEQVLINLFDNALKYSPPTGQVILRAARIGDRLRVQVLDEGIGIPAEDQEALFGKFQRAQNARRLEVPGTGLGLFICRSIIEAHGGWIMLASAPGAGTCVSFWLPVAARAA
jgi:PAS domain S-box-containing protein